MKQLFLLLIGSVLISSNSCEEPPGAKVIYSTWIKNNTGEGKDFIVSYNYPDTLIPTDYHKLRGLPANEKMPYDSDKKWKEVFEDLPGDTLSIFIFDEIITADNWDQIRSDYNIAQRYASVFRIWSE